VAKEQSPEDWRREVEREVERALADQPPDFAALVQELPSVDPLVVVDVLRWRATRGSAPAAALVASASAERPDESMSPRPIAHPLEYDWRFTTATASELVRRLERATGDDETIGYLGAPAAFTLAARELPRRQHALLDRSARWSPPPSGRARIISIDLLCDPLPALELDAAVLDPPWYPEYHDAFLWAAASLLRPRGLVLASFPPLAMRPRVAVEREEILRNAVGAGLVVDYEEPLALRYATPPFERAAYAAAGIRTVPDDWRRGDLLSLRKTDADSAEHPVPPNDRPQWEFVDIDEIPLAVLNLQAGSKAVVQPLLEPAVPGAILPTVSRRDSARADAVLWSSRNRIYTSAAPVVLRAVVRSLAGGDNAVHAAKRVLERRLTRAEEENVVATANQIRDLIRTEREEHGLG
jgi:hypothetical protein